VGIIFVLAASVAIQLPWFSCHSECQHAFLPVWDLGVHHCHDEHAHAHAHAHDDHGHHCLAHCGEDAAEPDGASEGEPGHDHGPGDHELQLQLSRRPTPPQTLTPDASPASWALLTAPRIQMQLTVASCEAVQEDFDIGPPARLASVRLLL